MIELPPDALPTAQSRCLPWQQDSWKILAALVRRERLPHALLLEGQPGTGRNVLATALARYLLCADPQDMGNCGSCKACALTATGAHADLLCVAPAEEGKAIGIDAIRSVIRFATGTATLGARKVILLSPAESMTTAAFNAFLKCLEEPSAETFIVLVSASGYSLPATIRSRCQRWFLPTPEHSQARQWLLEACGKASAGADPIPLAEQMLEMCDGRPLIALSRLQSQEADTLRGLHAALVALMSGDHSAGAHAEQAAAGVDPDVVLEVLDQALQRWLKAQGADVLRSPAGHRGFQALTTIGRLRTARRSGSNPNADLVQFQAIRAVSGLWDA